MGDIRIQQKDYDRALDYLDKSLKVHQEIGDKSSISVSYYFISTYCREIKQYDKALDYAYKAMKLGGEVQSLLTRQIASKFLYQFYNSLYIIDSSYH